MRPKFAWDIGNSQNRMPLLVLDGGLGTTLTDWYHTSVDDDARPLWSSHLLISDPGKLLAVQTAFTEAGANVILTATYQASFEGFARTSSPQDGNTGIPYAEAASYMRSAVGISRSSFKKNLGLEYKGLVALSLGAYGAVMVPSQEYTGNYDEQHRTVMQLRDWHKKRLEVFTENKETWADINMVAFETVPLLAEIEAVRETMCTTKTYNDMEEKPFWISCVFPGKDLCLPDGSSVEDVVRAMLGKRERASAPFAIGINCTKLPKIPDLLQQFEEAVRKLVEAGDLDSAPALVLYPDGTKGEIYNTTTHEWEREGDGDDMTLWHQEFFEIIKKLTHAAFWSAIIAGGCCKTTPEDIRKLRELVDTLSLET